MELPVTLPRQQFPNASRLPGALSPLLQQFVEPPPVLKRQNVSSGHSMPSSDIFASKTHTVDCASGSQNGVYPGPHDVSRQLTFESSVLVLRANQDNNVSFFSPVIGSDKGIFIWLCDSSFVGYVRNVIRTI